MVGITGHHIDRTTRLEDVSGLSKIGLSIVFAACLAALQFGIAGWFLSPGLDVGSRIAFVVITSLLGMSIVLIIDRNFIYAADTSPETGGFLTYFYLATRIFLILTISSLSSQFTLPLILQSELAIHVQDLKDERYDTAKERYTGKYEVKEKLETEQTLGKKVERLEKEINNLPKAIVYKQVAAQQCMTEYRKMINASIGPDLDENDVANLYARDKANCDRLEAVYKQAYQSYVTPKKTELASIEGSYKEIQKEVVQAKTALKTDLKRADDTNNQYLNVASSDVMWSLIKNNPGARSKYLMITLVQLVLELMPLLLKSLIGRSPLGIRIASNAQKLHHKYEESKHQYDLSGIEREAIKEKAKNEHIKGTLADQISIQEMKNRLAALKSSTRMNYFGMNGERTYTNVHTAWKSPLHSFRQEGFYSKEFSGVGSQSNQSESDSAKNSADISKSQDLDSSASANEKDAIHQTAGASNKETSTTKSSVTEVSEDATRWYNGRIYAV
jgi:hypothetical protein